MLPNVYVYYVTLRGSQCYTVVYKTELHLSVYLSIYSVTRAVLVTYAKSETIYLTNQAN